MFNTERVQIFSEIDILNYSVHSDNKKLLGVDYLYKNNIFGDNLVCAVLDTGCNHYHRALKDKIIGGRNFTNEGNRDDFSDLHGHGTHVAGLISSDALGSFEGGIAPKAKLLICKVLTSQGYGDNRTVIDGLNYAIEQKVNVINMSLGSTIESKELYDVIKRAYDAGIVICCASGNMGRGDIGDVDELCYPGAYQEVIEVGSINHDKIPSIFSNSNNMIDCVCYGEKILSTFLNNQFAVMDGTSQATPLISGCVLLLKEWFIKEFGREPSKDEIYATLIKCSTTLGGYNRKLTGFGYIDLKKVYDR